MPDPPENPELDDDPEEPELADPEEPDEVPLAVLACDDPGST
jgi:hypothetical protein